MEQENPNPDLSVSSGARPQARALIIQLGQLGEDALNKLSAVHFDSLSQAHVGTPIIGVGIDSDPQWSQLCVEFKTSLPQGVFVLILTSAQIEVVQRGVDVRVDYFLDLGSIDQIQSVFSQAEEQARQQAALEGRVRRGSEEIREFNRRREDLEKIVLERASNIKESIEEQEFRLQKIRSLIRWIRELSVASSLEDVLLLIKSEFRVVHSIGEFMLLVQMAPQQRLLHRLLRGQIHSQVVTSPIDAQIEDPQKNSKPWSQVLANLCQRPVGKLAFVELNIPLIRRFGFPEAQVFLVVENALTAKERRSFFEQHAERLSSLSITIDRLLLEEELTRYSYRWEKTFDGLREPLSIIDSNFKVIRSNLAFSDRGRSGFCYQLFQGQEKVCEGCPVPEAARRLSHHRSEVKRGDKVFEVHTFPIFLGQSAAPSNFVSLYVDISEQRSLTQRFIQAEKLSALGLLAGNIAHELNNPLTGLRSMAQLLIEDAPEGSQLRQDLQEVEKAAARSERIIRHLLEFADLESRELDWESLDEVIQRTLPLLKMTMRSHRVHIRLNATGRRVYVQSQLLQQVIFNLVSNACQAMVQPGQLIIETSLDLQSKLVLLRIADTGPGVPDELKSRIFEPFFTTKEEGRGTGLGLSLSREIIEKFKGRILMNSQVGVGTEFIIELPGES